MSAPRATCPECGRSVALYKDGKLYYHYGNDSPVACSGSMKAAK